MSWRRIDRQKITPIALNSKIELSPGVQWSLRRSWWSRRKPRWSGRVPGSATTCRPRFCQRCQPVVSFRSILGPQPWTKFSWQDEPWTEFSTLGVDAHHAMHLLHNIAIQPNLELKTWPKQLLGSLLLGIALPATTYVPSKTKCTIIYCIHDPMHC